MHRDMVGLITLDLILRIIRIGVVRVSLVINIRRMHFDDRPADVPGLRVPGYMISDFKLSLQDSYPSHFVCP